MSRIRILTVGATLATGLCLSACSSSSGGSGTAAPPPGSAGTDAAAAATAPAASAGSAGSTPASPPGFGSGGNFCHQLAGAGSAFTNLSDLGVTNRQRYIAKIRSLAAAAPAEIKSDVEVLEHIDEQVVNGNKLAENQLATPATAAHLRHFLAWMQANCPGVLDIPSSLPTG